MRPEDHLQLAQRNHHFYQELRREGRHLDWAVTVLFYVALHLVAAYATAHGETLADNHEVIRRYVRSDLAGIERHYRLLFDRSRDTRYYGWMPGEQDLEQLYQGPYQHIEAQLRRRGTHL